MTDTRIYRTELEQPSACGGRWGLYVDGRLIARTDRALAYEHKDQLHNFTASPPVLLDALHTLFKAAPSAPRGLSIGAGEAHSFPPHAILER